MRSSGVPEIDWRAVALGLVVALAIGRLGGADLGRGIAPIFGVAAPIFGIAFGGFLAGKRAIRAPAYQGVIVGAGYVVAEAVGLVPGPLGPSDNALRDTLTIFGSDLLLLVLAAGAAWLAGRASSSGTGRAR